MQPIKNPEAVREAQDAALAPGNDPVTDRNDKEEPVQRANEARSDTNTLAREPAALDPATMAGAQPARAPESATQGTEKPDPAPAAEPAAKPTPAHQLSASVPAPQPKRIAQQIAQTEPSFEEFRELLERDRSAAEDRQEIQKAQGALRAHAEAHRVQVLGHSESQKNALYAAAEGQKAAIAATVASNIEQASSHIQAQRDQLTALAAERQAAVRAKLNQDSARVRAASEAKRTELQQEIEARRTAFTQFVADHKRAPIDFAHAEADRASSELQQAANEASAVGQSIASQYPGQDDNKPRQRQAAQGVARESRRDILGKRAGIRSELLANAQRTTARYDSYLHSVLQELAQAEQQMVAQLDDALRQADESCSQAATAAAGQIEREVQVRSQSLHQLEGQILAQIRSDGQKAERELDTRVESHIVAIDDMAAAIAGNIDNAVTESEQHVASLDDPFVSGLLDLLSSVTVQVSQLGQQGTTQLDQSSQQVRDGLSAVAERVASRAAAATERAANQATEQNTQAETKLGTIEREYDAAVENALASMEQTQSSSVDQTLAQIDQGIQEAQDRIQQSTGKVKADITKGANQSITEAKKPLTDPLPDRCRTAAERAAEPWWKGALRAVGQIVVGFVILVAVAALVVVIAAALSVSLTFMGAMLIAGAIMLAAGVVMSTSTRMQAGDSFVPALGKGIVDAVGITGIYQGITNQDLFTGQELAWTDAERTEHGILGGVTLIGLLAGVRGALRGPLVRATAMPRWPGWRGAWANIKRDMGFFRADLATMARNFYLRLRYGRTRVQTPSDALRRRVYLRQETRQTVEANAPRDASGRPIDPNTGQPFDPAEAHFGHRYRHKWEKFRYDPTNQEMTRPQVRDAQNNPNIYQLEHGPPNQSHTWEQNPATLRGYPIIPDPELHDDQGGQCSR
ncbi:MAG: GH-E family nuclease [Proteobacteria bacterium]|nr:GH-E family nuclease [Pseudomonadota bacterium]